MHIVIKELYWNPSLSCFKTEVILPTAEKIEIDIANMYNAEAESYLAWYIEDYLDNPFTSESKVRNAKNILQQYGIFLFNSVFNSSELSEKYKKISNENSINDIHIEILSKSTEFDQIHWELLYDENLGDPLIKHGVNIVRKFNTNGSNIEKKTDSELLNILLVTARPYDNDINYRIIQRGILNGVHQSKFKINITILRPGTFYALKKELANKGQGFYQIVHFDTHGIAQENGSSLIFENERNFKQDPIEAEQIAELLHKMKVAVCVLNACKSGKNTLNSLSLGSTLHKKGVPHILAMSYNVTVESMQIFMTEFYEKFVLFGSFVEAVTAGRKMLNENSIRKGKLGVKIELNDWFVPICYSAAKENSINFNNTISLSQTQINNNQKYSFIGRDIEILNLERKLLRSNCVNINGCWGIGKTSLITHLCDWWKDTGFIRDYFYFTLDVSIEEVFNELSRKIVFENNKQVNILDKLNSTRYCLIFDETYNPILSELKNSKETLDFLNKINHSFVLSISSSLKNQNEEFDNYTLLRCTNSEDYEIVGELVESNNSEVNVSFKSLLNLGSGYPVFYKALFGTATSISYEKMLIGFRNGTVNIPYDLSYYNKVWDSFDEEMQETLLLIAPFQNFINSDILKAYLKYMENNNHATKILHYSQIFENCLKTGGLDQLLVFDKYKLCIGQFNPMFLYFLRVKLRELKSVAYVNDIYNAYIRTYFEIVRWHHELLSTNTDRFNEMKYMVYNYELQNFLKVIQLSPENAFVFFFIISEIYEAENKREEAISIGQEIVEGIKMQNLEINYQILKSIELVLNLIGLHFNHLNMLGKSIDTYNEIFLNEKKYSSKLGYKSNVGYL